MPQREHSSKDLGSDLFFSERSDFEKRLAQGKPFLAWFNIAYNEETDDYSVVQETYAAAIDHLSDVLAKEQPFDVLIAFSQGACAVVGLLDRWHKLGVEPPCRLFIAFSATPPEERLVAQSRARFELPTVLVEGPGLLEGDTGEYTKAVYRMLFSNLLVLEHSDEFGFPHSNPRAAQIYQELTTEIYRCCEDGARAQYGQPQATSDSTQTAAAKGKAILESRRRIAGAGDVWYKVLDIGEDATLKEARIAFRALALLHHPDKNPAGIEDDDTIFKRVQNAYEKAQLCCSMLRRRGDAVASSPKAPRPPPVPPARLQELREIERDRLDAWESRLGSETTHEEDVESVEPAELAEMLLEKKCVVVDAREKGVVDENDRHFPTALRHMSYFELKLWPYDTGLMLDPFRKDPRRVVIISSKGGRCKTYCCMLIDCFDFAIDHVCRLEGGYANWDRYERKNPDIRLKICRAHGVPEPSRGLSFNPRLDRDPSSAVLA